MQSSVSCDVILDPKGMKFLQVGMLGLFLFEQNPVFFVKKSKFLRNYLWL